MNFFNNKPYNVWAKIWQIGDKNLSETTPSGNELPVTNLQLTSRVVEGATYTYVGEALPGTATSAALWRVQRITVANNTILFADGNAKFDNIWDNYATLSYS